MAKSYFAILGISPKATGNEIKKAFRRLAKEFHPDHNQGSSHRFIEIQEAYAVLGNSRKRREYEQSIRKVSSRTAYRPDIRSRPEPLVPADGPVDMGDISPIRSFHSFSPSSDEIDWLWNRFSTLIPSRSGRVRNLTLEVTLTPEQARRGGTARITVPARVTCSTCHGYGGVGFYECLRCAGEGVISGEMPVSVSFPPGLVEDHAVMIPLDRFGIAYTHITVLFRPL